MTLCVTLCRKKCTRIGHYEELSKIILKTFQTKYSVGQLRNSAGSVLRRQVTVAIFIHDVLLLICDV